VLLTATSAGVMVKYAHLITRQLLLIFVLLHSGSTTTFDFVVVALLSLAN